MKKSIFTSLTFAAVLAFQAAPILAQTDAAKPAAAPEDKYTLNFRKAMLKLDTAWVDFPRMRETANQFERLAAFKKDDWMPFYYHALCLVMSSFQASPAEREGILKAAEASILAGEKLSPNNCELVSLEGMLYQAMILINPQANGMVYGPKSAMTLQKAMALDPNNPRPHYMLGSNLYFTPEQYGGGMARAKPHLEKALELFKTFKPASEFAPNWGQIPCQMILDGKMGRN